MRFLEPVSSDSVGSGPLEAASAASSNASGRVRFRPDTWLSRADANLLLRRQARWEAGQQNYAAAIRVFNLLIADAPENAEHYANRGLMHYRDRQWARAIADYDRAIELDSELDRAYSNRANVHARQKNWTAAIADYDRAVDLNPLNMRARLNQAITFREMGEYEEALACLDIATFFKPDSATLFAERGRVYHLRGDWNCAVADYTLALSLLPSPWNADGHNDLTAAAKVSRRISHWMNSFTQCQ